MDADRDSDAPQPEISAHVASCVIRVGELGRSLKFYGDVFACNVVVRETDMALLVAPNGFHHLPARPSLRRRAASTRRGPVLAVGHRHRIRSAGVAQRLRADDPGFFSHTENGVTVIEGFDPDGGRVMIGYTSPCQLTRTVIARRLRA